MTSFVLSYLPTWASVALFVGGPYALWMLFVCVMGLNRAKRAGTLSRTSFVLGMPILVVGVALDVLVNLTVCTVVFADSPRELMVTHRLRRYSEEDSGWRGSVARWVAVNLLDTFDPSGRHI